MPRVCLGPVNFPLTSQCYCGVYLPSFAKDGDVWVLVTVSLMSFLASQFTFSAYSIARTKCEDPV